MADLDIAKARNLPLAGLAATAPKSAAVRLEPVALLTRLSLRLRPASLPAATKGLGFALPVEPSRSAAKGDVKALWLGPDEWLILAPDAKGEAVRVALTAALTGQPASIVDISHRQAGLAVSGTRAGDTLSAFVALDLESSAFPVGMCTRTLLAKAEIVLWRAAPDTFQLEFARSLGAYVWASLEEARREFLDP